MDFSLMDEREGRMEGRGERRDEERRRQRESLKGKKERC